ncbi:hypothetical protein [Dyadobacter chenhuakuii]|uniref:DUF4935 domain-containing protein n=1 Tax=Dyadobacter chenhuakuii TaxID=2909339 RepID=A0ABY4XH67_9BACT|nr:hypothetical protein [Dyadobacter chenhuakuii]MCF2495615.1 hypothetical protein [Dyadobacter chenhuakuii]USJ29649.1 hypothetical protein NFI80_17400 [Dyadobacter chenhuakuii]
MIRIYLDWNVISNLKRPEYKQLDDFIIGHKEQLLFPYSPAHFKDLMKSYSLDNQQFDSDLAKLQQLTEKHFFGLKDNYVVPLFGTPEEYFRYEIESLQNADPSGYDFEKNVLDLDNFGAELGLESFGSMIKRLLQSQMSEINVTEENRSLLNTLFPNLSNGSNLWDFVKDFGFFTSSLLNDGSFYRNLRKGLGDHGFKLEPNAGNWSEDDVIRNIDEFLKSINTTFRGYIESVLKINKLDENIYNFFTTAYLVLDMIGYKSDKLPKPTDNMQNIMTDADHAFYAAHCDYLVGLDKKQLLKSKVLYNEFKLPVKILTPDQLIDELLSVMHVQSDKTYFVDNVLELYKKDKIVESFPPLEDGAPFVDVIKLDRYFFDFFNYATCAYYTEEDILIVTFKKVFKNYSKFVFYTEVEKVVDKICDYFADMNYVDVLQRRKFIEDGEEPEIVWEDDGLVIKVEKDIDTHRPILVLAVKFSA